MFQTYPGAGSILSFTSESGDVVQISSTALNNLKSAETTFGSTLLDSEIQIKDNDLVGTADQIVNQVKDLRVRNRPNFSHSNYSGTINSGTAVSVAEAKSSLLRLLPLLISHSKLLIVLQILMLSSVAQVKVLSLKHQQLLSMMQRLKMDLLLLSTLLLIRPQVL